MNQDCTSALFAPDGDSYFVGGELGNMYVETIKTDGSGLQRVVPEKALFLYDVSPDGKRLSVWVEHNSDIQLYPTDGNAPTLVWAGCASAGAEERGLTPPSLSWSRGGMELHLYSESTHQTYRVALKPGQVLPSIPRGGIDWSSGPPKIAGVSTVPLQADVYEQ